MRKAGTVFQFTIWHQHDAFLPIRSTSVTRRPFSKILTSCRILPKSSGSQRFPLRHGATLRTRVTCDLLRMTFAVNSRWAEGVRTLRQSGNSV